MVFWTAFLPPHHHAGRPKTQTMIASVPAFASMAMLINMAPGPDTLLVVRASMTQGRQEGLAAALGVLTGCAGWGIATAVGLTAVLTASPPAYDMLRICGAAYLAYLGATALWQSRRPAGPEPAGQTTTLADRSSAFRAGIGTNLLNPKAGVFYMSLIPQFVPPGAPMFSTTLLFTAIDVIELAVWYWLLSHAASALGTRLQGPMFRRRLEQLTGVTFLGFAAVLLTYRA
ncbi:LysE family translocator [Streptomyces sp. NPDC059278]|uniref:LysE family translocator n=1 Tax=Streptomyces sp. NPDC059278 TaxID=3346801 RepID=UPI0036CE52E9